MKISTKGRYALEAILDLALNSQTGLESLKNISDRLQVSKNYLEQLFMPLRQNGIVDSVRGALGGYRLAKPAGDITAGDILRAVEGPLNLVDCQENECCQNDLDYRRCITRTVWQGITDEISRTVDGVTLEALMEAYSKMDQVTDLEYYI